MIECFEILRHILRFLTYHDLCDAAFVCKLWKSVVLDIRIKGDGIGKLNQWRYYDRCLLRFNNYKKIGQLKEGCKSKYFSFTERSTLRIFDDFTAYQIYFKNCCSISISSVSCSVEYNHNLCLHEFLEYHHYTHLKLFVLHFETFTFVFDYFYMRHKLIQHPDLIFVPCLKNIKHCESCNRFLHLDIKVHAVVVASSTFNVSYFECDCNYNQLSTHPSLNSNPNTDRKLYIYYPNRKRFYQKFYEQNPIACFGTHFLITETPSGKFRIYNIKTKRLEKLKIIGKTIYRSHFLLLEKADDFVFIDNEWWAIIKKEDYSEAHLFPMMLKQENHSYFFVRCPFEKRYFAFYFDPLPNLLNKSRARF